jgi:hypothetical protein
MTSGIDQFSLKILADSVRPYQIRISRLTVDKLGVKLYDKASAVVAELIANGYDADAETVTVRLPLATILATKPTEEKLVDHGYTIEVKDDGHGMTPDEAIDYYLKVGRDRRSQPEQGSTSREKKRPVMGRKGIGKLAPFGICQLIEVISAGGEKTPEGYLVTHFYMDFNEILSDTDEPATLKPGPEDRTYRAKRGTLIRLSHFLPKRVPDAETFHRQLATRFIFARSDFEIVVADTRDPTANPPKKVTPVSVPTSEGTVIDLSLRPVITDNGQTLHVKGWLGMAKDAYKYEELTGVRIYARGKIIGTTRDFEQPAGFTGEFTMRSYLVGEVHAEWLDLDEGDDLIRTDRQGILWDSEYGQALRKWGAELIKEIGAKSRKPRRERTSSIFLRKSNIEDLAKKKFTDKEVVDVAVDLAKQIGAFASEDELEDEVYIMDLSDVILSVAPHKALIQAFQDFNKEVTGREVSLEQLLDLFNKTHIAEMASYSQVATERVKAIRELEKIVYNNVGEGEFQKLITNAPWLIEPTWSVISKNQALKTFKTGFEYFWKQKTGRDVVFAIDFERKRPDFTLVSVGHTLHIVEIKTSNHEFNDKDFERMINYVYAFDEFFDKNKELRDEFPRGWRIDLITDGVNLHNLSNKTSFDTYQKDDKVKKMTWHDFLTRAKKAHEMFLEISEKARDRI